MRATKQLHKRTDSATLGLHIGEFQDLTVPTAW